MSAKNIAIVGACYSRDLFNSNFIVDWKEYFSIKSFSFQTSIISLMSSPIPYLEKDINSGNEKFSSWYMPIFAKELNKSFLEELVYLQPANLLLDFYADVACGVYEIDYGRSYVTERTKDQINNNEFKKLNVTRLINVIDNHDEYILIWKSKFFAFKHFVEEKLPNTKVLLNAPIYANQVKNANGDIEAYEVETALRYNKIQDEFVSIAKDLFPEIEIIRTEKTYYADPSYLYGGKWIAHYCNDFYMDLFEKLKVLCIDDCCVKERNRKNLLINGDLLYGNHFMKRWDRRFFVHFEEDNAVVNICEKTNEKDIYAQIWFPDVVVDPDVKYLISFDCMVDSSVEMSSDEIAVVRSFDKEGRFKFADAVSEKKFFFSGTLNEYERYEMEYIPDGKFFSVGLYCKKNGCFHWKNVNIEIL